MANRPAPALVLREGDREELARITRSSIVRAGLAQRARIVLAAADGEANERIAARVGVSKVTVLQWRARYTEQGIRRAGRPGPQRPAADDRPPPDRGDDVEAAAEEVRGDALVEPAARYSIWGSGTPPLPPRGANTGCSRGGQRRSSSPPTPNWSRRSPTWSGCIWRRRRTRSCCASTRSPRSRRWTAPRRCCRCSPDSRTTHPRLPPARHHHLVRRPGDRHRQGHRRLQTQTPAPGVPGIPQAGRPRLPRPANCTW